MKNALRPSRADVRPMSPTGLQAAWRGFIRPVVAAGAMLAGCAVAGAAAAVGMSLTADGPVYEAAPPDEPLSLWYRRPAAQWLEALPVGNGRLGGMVFGGVDQEHIQLNEDTLWSGGPKPTDNTNALAALPEMRRLIAAGQYAQAHQHAKQMMGAYNQSYLPLGDLFLQFPPRQDVREYRRDLNLDTAIATTRYTADGVTYTEEVFSSHPDQVLVVRLTASEPGRLAFHASLRSRLRFSLTNRLGVLVLQGRAPAHVDPSYYQRPNPVVYDETGTGEGMRFECHLQALADAGHVRLAAGGLTVTNATRVTLLLSAATSYAGFDVSPGRAGKDPAPLAAATLAAATTRTYDDLRAAHVADHQALFRRVALDLGPTPARARDLTTDQRVKELGAADPGLVALHAQYGRYLLIASARPGTQPPNLQGIWNDEIRPPWSANYTLNINAQMNHWPAEVANLPECHRPFFELIRELSFTGRRTAQVHYGARGWVAHHNTDLWRQASPVGDYGHGDATWALWPMAGPWLCQHLWQHFEFNGDTNWLRAVAYPLMKGAAQFCRDFLIEDAQGRLVTSPSTSPEHGFIAPDGQRSAVSQASTMDMSLIGDLFGHCIEAADILGTDAAFRADLAAARARLLPPPIAADGRLQEWFRDFQDWEPKHRHVSHLWGLYPGHQFTARGTPDFAQAVRRSLEVRSDEGTGWSTGWKICLWARLLDGDHAFRLIERTLRLGGGGVYVNLFGSHPPFQMDGNFAFTAGVAEMLLQSHAGEVELLPALPRAWPTGAFRGLRARGGFEVDAAWQDGRLVGATLRPTLAGPVTLRHGARTARLEARPGVALRVDASLTPAGL